jgi:hypothetical protein
MTREVKDLLLLAIAVVFAMGSMVVAGSWHDKSYTVAQPQTSPARAAAVTPGTRHVASRSESPIHS